MALLFVKLLGLCWEMLSKVGKCFLRLIPFDGTGFVLLDDPK